MDSIARYQVYRMLEKDADISALALAQIGVDSFQVYMNRPIEKPDDKRLEVVIEPAGSFDVAGLHGAVVDIFVDVSIRGWDLWEAAWNVADIINRRMLSAFSGASDNVDPSEWEAAARGGYPDGSFIRKFRLETGFQTLPEQHPRLASIRASYSARYWSRNTIQAVRS